MTLNTFKTGAAALLGIAGVFGTAQADGIDFKGYVRSGIGSTSGGGDQVCFQAANTPGKFRLGNECETYSELSLGKSLYKQDGKEFYLQTTVAYVSEQKNGFESITPQSDFGDGNVASREFAIIGRNVVDQLPGATLWAGKRFIKRNDIHMRDYYYWDVSGPGAGIEDIDVGPMKFSVSWTRSTSGSSNDNFDFRFTDYKVSEQGSLDFGVTYGDTNLNPNDVQLGRQENDGTLFTVQHTQGGFFGGFNKFVVQYGQDAMASEPFGGGAGLVSSNTRGDMVRVLTHGVVEFNKHVEMMYSVIFENLEKDDGTGRDWASVGIRPIYKWTGTMSTALEVGHDEVDQQTGGASNGLSKITLAQQWAAGSSIWSRPVLRAFVTHATWDGPTANSGGVLKPGATSGTTVGLQAEAWW